MTEKEWTLARENALLKMQLAQVQSQLVQGEFTKAKADLEALGDKWVAPDNVVELSEVVSQNGTQGD